MKVAVLPCVRATFLTMYLNHMSVSAISISGRKRMSISHWPAVATSWCAVSTLMPTSTSVVHHLGAEVGAASRSAATGK